jgi:hypothetical protein
MSEGITALLGVIVGFLLNETSKLFKDKRLSKKLKKALEDELSTNLFQLDQKIDIANQMIYALNQGKFLPGISVPFASTVYDHHFPSILKDLNPIQRDNVRHIYSNLTVLDEVLFSFEKSYKEDIQQSVLADTNNAYVAKINDVLNNYKVLKDIINCYLNENPKDIYYRNKCST